MNNALVENTELKAKIDKEQKKTEKQKNTILKLRREVKNFKAKSSKQEIQIRQLKNSIFNNSELDVRE